MVGALPVPETAGACDGHLRRVVTAAFPAVVSAVPTLPFERMGSTATLRAINTIDDSFVFWDVVVSKSVQQYDAYHRQQDYDGDRANRFSYHRLPPCEGLYLQ